MLAHNRGVANPAYLAKAVPPARCAEGERIEVAGPFHRESWELLCRVVADMTTAILAKPPNT